ncbi:terminase small subunit [Cricetibacter osteomyelitidis]|uniref:Terminase small subunit n=1 Tax=Cricetibacter osteomyelitidis TaxID=1521931 RepID=A0A4R2T2D7_9PAST|nr:terminase small subunit [Cricetibacter osteomyelitidis]TCP95336.1 terminase small subunit [Cricetibacter osteomyelitidis]
MELTPKQDNFCLKYVETGNASEAYRQAYNAENMKSETVNRKASELLENGKITARIDELQAEHRERHKLTVDDLLHELETARKQALELNQCSVAVSATMGKAKLLGLDKQKVEVEEINKADFPTEIRLVAPDFEDWSEAAKEMFKRGKDNAKC